MGNEKVDFVSTVGELHSAIESIGPNAWRMFVELWHQSCGIQTHRGTTSPSSSPDDPATETHGKPDTPSPPLSDRTPPLDPGLHAALPSMSPRAVAFLLHTPPPLPVWFCQESESEKAERQALEDIGGWVGG